MQPQSIELLASHASIWKEMQTMLEKKKFSQSLLFVGPRHAGMEQFAHHFMAAVLCQDALAPCGICSACHLVQLGTYPDIHYVRPDSPNAAIKIEQIRALQNDVYQTPTRGRYRFILISPADKMNLFAANALLKILEEPPAHTLFILLTECVSSLPATILSRCQRHTLESIVPADYLMLGELYEQDTARAELFKQNQLIIDGLENLLAGKVSPCTLASQWTAYAHEDLLWFLYLLNAQVIRYQVLRLDNPAPQWAGKIKALSQRIQPTKLFKQLDQINALMQKINHNINTNQTLALENLLLGYLG